MSILTTPHAPSVLPWMEGQFCEAVPLTCCVALSKSCPSSGDLFNPRLFLYLAQMPPNISNTEAEEEVIKVGGLFPWALCACFLTFSGATLAATHTWICTLGPPLIPCVVLVEL